MNSLGRVIGSTSEQDVEASHSPTLAPTARLAATLGSARTICDPAGPTGDGENDAIALQSLLEKHFGGAVEGSDGAARMPVTKPTIGPAESRWKSRLLKSLVGLALVAIAGWMPAQRLFEVSSVEAVVNARLVTVRAPIAGVIQLDGRGLSVGDSVAVGAPLATVKSPRIDRSRLNVVIEQLGDANEERQALASKLQNLAGIRHGLRSQLAAFRDNRIRQVAAEIAEADARIQAARAEQARADAGLERHTKLAKTGAIAATAVDNAGRDATVAAAAVDEAQASRAVLSVELKTLNAGGFLGDDYNDQPRSAQRLDEIEQSIASVEADIVRLDSRIARMKSSLRDEQQSVDIASQAALASPVGGQVWEVLTAPGEQVEAGQSLFSFLDCADAIVTATVSEAVYNSLSVGMHATFTYREGGAALAGTVVQLSGVASASSNFAIAPSALTKESYRVAVSVKGLRRGDACAVGRTGRVVFGSEG